MSRTTTFGVTSERLGIVAFSRRKKNFRNIKGYNIPTALTVHSKESVLARHYKQQNKALHLN